MSATDYCGMGMGSNRSDSLLAARPLKYYLAENSYCYFKRAENNHSTRFLFGQDVFEGFL